MRQFSVAHLVVLATLLLGATLAITAPHRYPGTSVRLGSRVLAGLIFAGWLGDYIAQAVLGTWAVRYSLPLQLTDAVSLAAILALITGGQLLIELLYFWAFSASLQAVLTPDLGSTFPSVFYFTYFLYHVGSLVAACLLVFGCRRYPRPGAFRRVFVITLAFTAIVSLGDVITGGNYMYLRAKPIHHSLLNVMGPWPWYILAGAAIGLALFVLLQAIADAVRRGGGAVALAPSRQPPEGK